MNILPIITRELRVEARRGFNHRLRISMLGLIVMIVDGGAPPARVGIQMFGVMHVTMLIFALVMVPVIASDSLAREKREGTLGLLFLTHLKGWEIVLAKGFVHSVRAAGCWLAALPVLVVPFLLGGLTWLDFMTAAIIQFVALALGLGISMCVSAKLRTQSLALGLSVFLNIVAMWIAGLVFTAILLTIILKVRPPTVPPNFVSWETMVFTPAVLLSGILDGRTWSSLTSLIPGLTHATWYQILGELALATSLIMTGLFWLAARLAEAGWKDRPRTATQEKWHQRFFGRFIWKDYFHRRAGRLLDRNPIIWLQGYSVEARMGKWGWCLLSVIVLSIMSALPERFTTKTFIALVSTLLAGLAFSAARSFADEKKSGALELILVTAVREYELIFGRLLGLWIGFIPTLLLVFFGWSAVSTWNLEIASGNLSGGFWLVNLLSGWAFLPVIGLSLALRMKHVISAWLGTALLWLLPILLMKTSELAYLVPWWPTALLCVSRLVAVCLLGYAWLQFQPHRIWMKPLLLCVGLPPVVLLGLPYHVGWSNGIAGFQAVVLQQAAIAIFLLSLLFKQLRERRFVIDGRSA